MLVLEELYKPLFEVPADWIDSNVHIKQKLVHEIMAFCGTSLSYLFLLISSLLFPIPLCYFF